MISFSPNKCYRFLLAVGWHVRGSWGFVPWVRGGIRDAGGQGLSLTDVFPTAGSTSSGVRDGAQTLHAVVAALLEDQTCEGVCVLESTGHFKSS